MRNKIFLTSMFAVMLAFPAYATPSVGTNNCPDGSGNCGVIEDGDASANCNATPLTYESNSYNYGTYTLTAQWKPDTCQIVLNPHTEGYGATSSNPATLYAIFGDAVYLDSATNNAMTTSTNGLTANPTGKTYTLTLNPNLPTGHTTSEISGSTDYAATTTAQMQFKGFYSAAQSTGTATNGTKYIDTDKLIETDGITAGTSIQSTNGACPTTTWHAQYTCQNAATYTPSLAGYTFEGWYSAASGGTQVNNFCLTANETVYAHWRASSCNVSYNPTANSADPSAPAVTHSATYDSPYSVPARAGRGESGSISEPAPGYSFAGWTTNSTPTFTGDNLDDEWTWTDGSNWTSTTCPTLYAAYSPNQYTVTYDCTSNGGTLIGEDWTSSTPGIDQVIYGVTNYPIRTAESTCSKTGYYPTLSCHRTGTALRVETPVREPWNLPYNVTCVAKYSEHTYNITYTCGEYGPSGNTSQVSGNASADPYDYGSTWTLRAVATNCTTPAGWSFAGWRCDVNPSTGQPTSQLDYYLFNAIMTTTGDWAHTWAAIQNNNGTYSQYTGTYSYEGDIECEATWSMNKVLLEWEDDNDPANGDTSSVGGSEMCQYGANGEVFAVPATAPTKTGYTFRGWKVTNWDGSDYYNN